MSEAGHADGYLAAGVVCAIRSCIWRVRCGTMPSILSTSISCPRWCISCSFTDSSISTRDRLAIRHARRHRDSFRQEIVGEPLEELRELLAACLQQIDNLGFRAWLALRHREPLHHAGKIKSRQSGQFVHRVHLILEAGGERHVSEQLTDRPHIRCRSEACTCPREFPRQSEWCSYGPF